MKVLLFGIAREIVGAKEMEVSAATFQNIDNIKGYLFKDFPKLGELKSLNFAINEQYVTGNQLLTETDVVALIPPVSGG